MKVVRTIEEMKAAAGELRAVGKRIGLVPTMGFFHEGHLSLMRRSGEENDFTIVSLFVNPTQFGPNEDLSRYPRDFDRDCEMAEGAGVDCIFFPEACEVYPTGFKTYIEVEEWSEKLCGISRPIHFRGVTTVCCKLFNICKPDRAYFGLKDAQQFFILKKMVKDLDMDVEIAPVPIVREEDGLAMSSRNVYLSEEERKDAVLINEGLGKAVELFAGGTTDSAALVSAVRDTIESSVLFKTDYVEAVNTETFERVKTVQKGTLIAAAAFIGKTRLIDNRIL